MMTHLPLKMLIVTVAVTQWVLVALISLIVPLKMRKALAISTGLLTAAWLLGFDARSLIQSQPKTVQASAIGATHTGSCASIQNNMSGGEVKRRLGNPDEVRNDEKVRGPNTSTLVYRDLRCAVHLFDDRVELVD